MAKDTKNFKVTEFACHHCGENLIDQRVIEMAQKIRDRVGRPIRVNSGYRCAKHNAEVGGVKNSCHTKGLAADLSCEAGAKVLFAAAKELYNEGALPELSYCIRYKWGIHIDCGQKRKGLWEIRA